jgi:hypothetical protein
MAATTTKAFEKDDMKVEVIQHKAVTSVGAYNTVAYKYECRATRAGQPVSLDDLMDGEKMPQNYRGAIAFGQKAFKRLKQQKRAEVA